MLSTNTSTLSWMPWFPTHPQRVCQKILLVLPSKISSIWSLHTTFIATRRLLLYNSLFRGGYPSTLLNPLRSSLSTAAWAMLLIQPHHTARTCPNADSGLQDPPKSTTPLFSSTVYLFSLQSSPFRSLCCFSIMHDKRALELVLPSSWNVLTPDCSSLLPHHFPGLWSDFRKAFLYYSIKLQPILSSHLRTLSPFLALLFSKALNILQHA